MTAFSALLFAYMVGLLLLTLSWGVRYSFLQWVIVGVMVAGSAVLLAWQIRKVLLLRRTLTDS